ncbi:hypothetical protein [Ferruginibacter sp. SUN106]|uniref:hypothetical protein n=1 Tax=Ferruginibacter sp. SUN106 TaxID=2978348 RepID=UPI003D35E906
MWTSIKSLFSSKTPDIKPELPHDFDQVVKQAISLLKHSGDVSTDEKFLNYLTNNGIEYTSAVEILLFLPIAFVRQWLPTAKWLDTYVEYVDEKKQIEKKYSETKAYQIIWNVTTEYFANNPDRDTVFKIGGRSTEFNVINKALNDNPNSNLEDLELSQTFIVR